MFCGLLHCSGQRVPGAGQRYLQHGGIHRQTAVCAAAVGLSAVTERQCEYDLVGIPHCGVDEPGDEYFFPDKNISEYYTAYRVGVRLDKIIPSRYNLSVPGGNMSEAQ